MLCSTPLYMPLFSSTMNTHKEEEKIYTLTLETLMDSPKSKDGTATLLHDSSTRDKSKAAILVPITKPTRWKKGIAIFDFIFRLVAIAAALAATAIMATTDETLPFFTQFLQFHAEYNDFPTFTFFVIGNAAASAYLILSLPFSIVCIVRPHVSAPRFLLLILDTVMGVLTTAAASSAASIVYLAHNGNSNTNWTAICQQFGDFCQQVSLAVVASFVAALHLAFLVVLSMFALKRTTTY